MNNLSQYGIKQENIKELVEGMVVTSREAQEILGISRVRICQLVKAGKLNPIKKNIFLLDDILRRKEQQKDLRLKFYKPGK